ncbi:MAG: DEAD/DEAH box helicase [Myxococcota bacterium]
MEYRGFRLDAFQEAAITTLRDGGSVLVCAPTGTGKTIIADWMVDDALSKGKRVMYTAPIKALSNQKFRDYRALHGEEAVGLLTGDLVINRDAPCLVMTTEILRNMLLTGDPLDDLVAVVLDEIHFLDDRERGTVWEEVLIYLPASVQIVGLSATLSNVEDFASWLEKVRGTPVRVIEEHKRAVPLEFHHFSVDTGLVDPNQYDRLYRKKRARGRSGRDRSGRDRDRRRGRRNPKNRKTGHMPVFHAMREHDLLPYLFFVFSRRDTEILARGLSQALRRSLLTPDQIADSDLMIAETEVELGHPIEDDLRRMYRKGVAFHHAGLHVGLKALVEQLYEQRLIQVLYCTSTFALGINMPARSVVFDGLKKYDGRVVNPLTTRQFMQKAGRAGRRGMDEVGHVVLRLDLDDYEEAKPHLEQYRKGTPEPVRSSFNLSFNSIVNLIDQLDQERIRDILDRSFLAWHLERRAADDARRAEVLQQESTSRKEEKAARKLAQRAERRRSQVWEEYQTKVTFLQNIGYLDENLGFNAGARVLKHVQIAEIFVTELFLEGLLEELQSADLFGVLSGMTNTLPRHARASFEIRREERALARRVSRVRQSFPVVGAEELTGIEVDWDPDVMSLGRRWAEGVSLQEILAQIHCETDISGDLITGFRRAKDLASQLKDVYTDVPERVTQLKRLVIEVSRDEVEVVG